MAEIAEAIRPKLGPGTDENLVRVALGRLEAVRLLESGLGHSAEEVGESRRAFLRKGAAAGAVSLLMPVVATLPRPSLAAALSPVGPQATAAARWCAGVTITGYESRRVEPVAEADRCDGDAWRWLFLVHGARV